MLPISPYCCCWRWARLREEKNAWYRSVRLRSRSPASSDTSGLPASRFNRWLPSAASPTTGCGRSQGADSLRRTGSGDLLTAELRSRGIRGGLPESLYRLLVSDRSGASAAAQWLLDEHFPVSMHQHILEAVGLDGLTQEECNASKGASRDPRFRELVLTAYERRCAFCGFDLRLNDDLLGLEAAHVRWHSHGGPDWVTNGLALCSFHHGAFDRGAIGLARAAGGVGYRMLVSADVNGTSAAVRWLLDYHGQPVRPPQTGAGEPHGDYVAWHTDEVFSKAGAGTVGAASMLLRPRGEPGFPTPQ